LYLAIGSSTLHAYKEYTEPYPSAQLSPIPFSRFFDSFNGLRYAPSGHRWVGVDSAWEQKKPKARKMLENGDESHLSSARFVRRRLTCKPRLLLGIPKDHYS
jgi:hypothetical protein